MTLSPGRNIVFVFFIVFAWILQSQLILKGDVSWLMHLAQLALNGGHYMTDFFEINPPLSFLLYMPAIFIEKSFSISAIVSLRIYIFSLSFVSIFISNRLINKIFYKDDCVISSFFFLSLPFVYLILPLNEFGQRENILVILTVPYLLLMACYLGEKKVSPCLSGFVGFLAGVGFCIKPFFLVSFFLIELYCFYRKNFSIFCFLRLDFLFILMTGVVYILSIIFFYPSYLSDVVPIAKKFYYEIFSYDLSSVIFNLPTIFCFFSIVLYFLFYKKNKYLDLRTLLLISLVGYFLSYFIQKIAWYYHLLPVLSLAVILDVLQFGLFFQEKRSNFYDNVLVVALAGIIFIAPLYVFTQFYLTVFYEHKNLKPLIQYLNHFYKNQYVYFFSGQTAYMVSVFEHAEVKIGSRLQFLFWMKNPYRLEPSQKNIQVGEFFVDMLSKDLRVNQPKVIFVDIASYKTGAGKNVKIDYLSVLKKYPQFASVWKNYHYSNTFKKEGLYEFEEYKLYSSKNVLYNRRSHDLVIGPHFNFLKG